jgi:hypothetical protein
MTIAMCVVVAGVGAAVWRAGGVWSIVVCDEIVAPNDVLTYVEQIRLRVASN